MEMNLRQKKIEIILRLGLEPEYKIARLLCSGDSLSLKIRYHINRSINCLKSQVVAKEMKKRTKNKTKIPAN